MKEAYRRASTTNCGRSPRSSSRCCRPKSRRCRGSTVAVHYQTAKRAGGDYYDFFPLPNDRLGVLIADASGHGAPAAVLMAVAHSIAHTRPEPPQRPGRVPHVPERAPDAAATRGRPGSFMTAFYAVFDPANGDPELRQRRPQPAAPAPRRRRVQARAQPRAEAAAGHQAGRGVPRTDGAAAARRSGGVLHRRRDRGGEHATATCSAPRASTRNSRRASRRPTRCCGRSWRRTTLFTAGTRRRRPHAGRW